MREKRKGIYIIIGMIAALVVLAGAVSFLTANWFQNMKKDEAEIILNLAQKNIVEILAESKNEALMVAEHVGTEIDNIEQFREIADKVVDKGNVSKIYLVKDTEIIDVVGTEVSNEEVGKQLNEFPYAFSMAGLLKTTVVEGPVQPVSGADEVFIFIEPILSGEDYIGEVIAYVDADVVLDKLNLAYLKEKGYDYELWRIDSQDGAKRMVAQSDANKDMSGALRNTFYLPAEWTLALEPVDGWISFKIWVVSALMGILTLGVFALICYFIVIKSIQYHKEVIIRTRDMETGMYNRTGFTEKLSRQIKKGLKAYTLFVFVMDEYAPLARIMGTEQKKKYLEYITKQLEDSIKLPHIYGRLGEGTYAVAVFEDQPDTEAKDLAKELSLELLWKTEIDNRREYIHVRWDYLCYPQNGEEPDKLLDKCLKQFDARYIQREAEEKTN